MIEYGLLGETLTHSFSPRLHRAFGGYDYRLLPTPRGELDELFARRQFLGLNVTMPYKQTVMPLCDEIDNRAAQIGAVNTVVNRDGRLIGYNTDIDGLLFMARRSNIELNNKKVLILGSGGTSRTATAAARECGAREIVIISRNGENNYENLSRHADADIIINTTPVGMFPHCGQSPVDLSQFPNLSGVLDAVYNPLRTALFMQAERLGIPCSCGLPMLTAQAKRASELFTGTAISNDRTEEVFSALHRELENIVLIGMPGCGKSTIAAALVEKTGREVVDIDEMITQREGLSTGEVLILHGEQYFRALESACIREAGARTGIIISTGGGCVTRAENYAPLHQNGYIIHITRGLSRLSADGRPISQRTDAATLWAQRKDQYKAFADTVVDNNGTVEQTLEHLTKEWNER
ncbi:MAG: AAA family ATPase [Oscillospiraceae bacterium]|nr:AAA family ATPase [Oscillospiraceae bacterium]